MIEKRKSTVTYIINSEGEREEKQMTDHRVFSGYTEKIDEQRKTWYEQLAGKRLEWEDLAAARSTNEILGKMESVPLYQYLVNYLLYVWERGENHEIRYDQMISDLTDRVADAFKRNGMPEEKCAKAHVRDMLTTEWNREWDSFERAAGSRIFELGLGLGLPADDVEQLLQKAVRRAGFNYYDPEELIVYCALKFCGKDHYRCARAMLRDYRQAVPLRGKERTARFENTSEVRDQMLEMLEGSVEDGRLYSTDTYEPGTLNPGLAAFFSRHKAALPEVRTAAVVFEELLEKFIEAHRKDILDFKSTDRGSEEYAKAVLKVEYDAGRELELPAGTTFYALKGKEKRRVGFVLENAVVLPGREDVEVEIPVKGTEPQIICLAKKTTPGYVGKLVEMIPEERALKAGVMRAYTSSTLKYTGNPGEKQLAKGTICAVCSPGTVLPAGTLFTHEEFSYAADTECRAAVSADIPVRSEHPCRKGEKIAETGEIRYMDNPPEGILSVTNGKPVSRKEQTEKISKELFRDFLYVKDAERLGADERQIDRTLLGHWFTETEITSVRFSNIRKQADEKSKMTRAKMERPEVRRCDIITMAFLNFCADTDDDGEEYLIEAEPEAVYQDFLLYVNPLLRKCGMMPFYLQNPYEYLLAYLIQTDTPVDSLRNMWKIVNAGKEETDD